MTEAREPHPPLTDDAPRESLGRAFSDVVKALVAAPLRRISPRTSERVIAGCALIALICPLLLWISWSKMAFLIVIGTALTCVAIIYLLIWVHPDDPF